MISLSGSVFIPDVDSFEWITEEQIIEITIPCGITLGSSGAEVAIVSGRWTRTEQQSAASRGEMIIVFFGFTLDKLFFGVLFCLLMLVVSWNVKGLGCPQKRSRIHNLI